MATTGFNNVEYVRVLRLTNTNLIENIEACAPDSVFTGGVVVTDDMRGYICLLYTSPSPRDRQKSRMPSSA